SVYAIMAALLAIYAFMQPSVPVSQRSVYVPVSGNVGPMTAELDPRNNAATDTPYDAHSAEQHVHDTLQNSDSQHGDN
ncbi:MAG: hypothetical protein M3Z51_05325, partial [Snodgrassella alvi]|nr:hypothetical protein [Snodgrassella alvi]